MNPRILRVGVVPCVVCGELIEKRRKVDGTFKQRQPSYCSYQCWYHARGPQMRAVRMSKQNKG